MSRISRVMLILPYCTIIKSSLKRCFLPFGIAYIGGVLERSGEVEVSLLDAAVEGYYHERPDDERGEFITYGLTQEEVKQRIKEFSPDMVGVSCSLSSQIKNVCQICRGVKEVSQEIITVVGGLAVPWLS